MKYPDDLLGALREIGRLRECVRVNALRWGYTHAEIDKMLAMCAETHVLTAPKGGGQS